MNKILWSVLADFCIIALSFTQAYACIDSNCRPCPIGFSVTKKCCSDTDKNDCVILYNDEFEDCGLGKWEEYSHSFPVKHNDYCCKDATENNCRSSSGERFCGTDINSEYPYSPVKKCCKDLQEKDCVIIRSKKRCGVYQMEKYPVWEGDCCNSFFKKCTGQVKDCPKCISITK